MQNEPTGTDQPYTLCIRSIDIENKDVFLPSHYIIKSYFKSEKKLGTLLIRYLHHFSNPNFLLINFLKTKSKIPPVGFQLRSQIHIFF
jgi:hypothetical protein